MKVHRRTFLRAAGVALALPWLEAMPPTRGQTAGRPPRRLVFICNTLGLHEPAFFPKKTGADYEETEYLAPLREHRKDYTLFSGLSHPDQFTIDHRGEQAWLTGAPKPGIEGFRNSISVDQLAASRLGYTTRFPSLTLSSDGALSQSITESGVMLPAEERPSRVFAQLFLRGNPRELARQKEKLAAGRSILDGVLGQARALLRGATATDRARLEEYFESVRSAERNLAAMRAWLDRPKPRVAAAQPRDLNNKADLIGRVRLLLDLVPLIVQTDSCRVITITIQNLHGVPLVEGVSGEHHNLSHHGRDPAKIAQLKKIEGALMERFAAFLGQMKAKTERGETLLDHTAVLFGSNLGNANSHDPRNNPVLVAGGGLPHGSYVAHDAADNTALCNLFLRLLRGMGWGDIESFSSSTGVLRW